MRAVIFQSMNNTFLIKTISRLKFGNCSLSFPSHHVIVFRAVICLPLPATGRYREERNQIHRREQPGSFGIDLPSEKILSP